jgi:uncharacterized protein (TIGR03437 family)
MKWTVLLILAASCLQAQQFVNGQAARLVIGQPTWSAQDPVATASVIGSAAGVAYGGNALVIADGNNVGGTPVNNRVLIYPDVKSFVPGPHAQVPQINSQCPACIGTASVVLGQPDFVTTTLEPAAANTVRKTVGVSYNGRLLAVADTDNNRVLIWKGLPNTIQAPADFVVGQSSMTSGVPLPAGQASPTSLRGPEGVWLDDANGLWVADTANSRVLYYGEITQNGQSAKFALGQPDLNQNQQFTKYPLYLTRADTLLSPTSVTTDGRRVLVADNGANRILIWNTIPTASGKAADVVIGQPDMDTSLQISNILYAPKMCPSNGTDANGVATYPIRCAATLSRPRFALIAGEQLFVSDSGNDRVLVFNQVPTANAASADVVLGQPDFELNQSTDSGNPQAVASSGSFKTPSSLAWDGENLYVADIYNRRIMVFSPGDVVLPLTAVRNAASPFIYAAGYVTIGGTVTAGQTITINIGNNQDLDSSGAQVTPAAYSYTTVEGDDVYSIVTNLVALINAGSGDPNAIATPNYAVARVILTARNAGELGNNVTLSTSVTPSGTTVSAQPSGVVLKGGGNSALIAPFELITILGSNLSDFTTPVADLTQPLPTEAGGVQVYIDGILSPIIAVSPDRVLAQMPIETFDRTSSSALLRIVRKDGTIQNTTANIILNTSASPAVFNDPTVQPSPGLVYHYSSQATGTVSVDGTPKTGDTGTITIRDRSYSFTASATDTTKEVMNGLALQISLYDPEVDAIPSGEFARVRLKARVPGPVGNGIPFSASNSIGGGLLLTAFNSQLCCANEAGAPVTVENPAQPGETIVVLASGLGEITPDEAREQMINGQPYAGTPFNNVTEFIAATIGGTTGNVLFSGLREGAVGIYEVHLELNTSLPTNPRTDATIAQLFQVSNIFTFAVANPRTTP